MTKTSWLASTEPDEMLVLLRNRATDRKLRLFCCACVRRVWDRLAGAKASRQAVEVAEAFVDGQATQQELEAASLQAQAVVHGAAQRTRTNARTAAAWCATAAIDALGVTRSVAWAAAYARPSPKGAERIAQAHLLREIFYDPSRPTSIVSEVLKIEGAVVGLARAAYEERSLPSGLLDNSRLAVLADALEEAGCTDDAVLAHCRGPGPHMRGCWVIDLILKRR